MYSKDSLTKIKYWINKSDWIIIKKKKKRWNSNIKDNDISLKKWFNIDTIPGGDTIIAALSRIATTPQTKPDISTRDYGIPVNINHSNII